MISPQLRRIRLTCALVQVSQVTKQAAVLTWQ
jgi:hypothetical protein